MTQITKNYELPCLDSRKSFYGKAFVKIERDTATLQSYSTDVIKYNMETGEVTRLWAGYSATTMRHINSFLIHMGIDGGDKSCGILWRWHNMAKYKTTRKAIVNSSTNIKCAGYCALQALLKYHEPQAYTCGVYGWNFDVYEVYGVTICTGYRNMPGARLEGIREYEEKARAINNDYSLTWEVVKTETEKLLWEFCKLNGGY
jgi:hypothetical protein